MITSLFTACQISGITGVKKTEQNSNKAVKTPADGKKEPVSLRFSWWGSDARAEATLKVISQFHDKYPWITINGEYSSSEGYNDKISTQLSAGTAPDIIQLANNMPAYYKGQGVNYFIDLKANGFDFSKFDSNYLSLRSNGNVEGEQVGIPTGLAGAAFLINKDLAEKVGVNLYSAYTWDDLIAAGKKVKAYNPDLYLLNMNTDYIVNLVFKPYYKQIVGNTFVDEKTKKLIMTQESLEKTLQLVQALYRYNVIPPASYSSAYMGDKLQTDPKWVAGKYVSTLCYISTIEVMTSANPKVSYEIGELPTLNNVTIDGWMINSPSIMVVNNKTKNPKEAMMFLDYFFNDKTSVETLGTQRSVPPTAEARTILTQEGLLNPLLQKSADISISHKGGVIDDRYSDSSEGFAIFQQAVESIGYGASDPEKAAANILNFFKYIVH
jgi:ABC-type sugar transport system, periplasmic component